MASCVECRWFQEDGFVTEDHEGFCKRYGPAPHFHQRDRSGDEFVIKTVWPVVSMTENACGDFKVTPGE